MEKIICECGEEKEANDLTELFELLDEHREHGRLTLVFDELRETFD